MSDFQNITFSNESGGIVIGSGIEVSKKFNTQPIVLGNFATALGKNSIAIGCGGTNNITAPKALGDFSIAIGNNIISDSVNGLGEIKIGSPQQNLFYYDGGTGWKSGSDVRDKINITNIEHSLDFITSIEPIKFKYNYRKYYSKNNSILNYDEEEHAKGTKADKNYNYGVKAQQVGEVLKSIYGSEYYGNIITKNTEANYDKVENAYFVNLVNFIPFLIGSIKELQKEIDELKQKLGDQNGL